MIGMLLIGVHRQVHKNIWQRSLEEVEENMHPSRTDIIVYRKAKLRIVENALVASKLAIFSETTLGLP